MKRFQREQAHTLSMDDLANVLEAQSKNPCMERLIFVETRKTPRKERSLFPCWTADIREDKDHKRTLVFFAVQLLGGQYNTVCMQIPEENLGKICRFWNLPPAEEAMDADPLPESTEVQ